MQLISEAPFEKTLAALARDDPRAGLFGPASMRWRIDREAALFLGAGRALLLQLAHPFVAAAVAEHSRALDDPIGRFHGTFGTVFALVFGTAEDAFAAARRLYHRHRTIAGRLPDGSAYAANEPEALRWVHATLTDTALAAYRLVLPLSDEERAGYHADSRRFGGLFGLDPAALPQDWAGFAAYWDAMVSGDTLEVGDTARTIADRLLGGAGSWIVSPPWYRALTAGLMPERLRAAYRLPYGDEERRLEARARTRLVRIYSRLPARLRFVGPYFEACERLSGRSPSRLTRLSNRFWIGRAMLGPG